MKEYKITSFNITTAANDDCYIAPSDPLWDLMPAHTMGGLGSAEALAKYNQSMRPVISGSTKGQEARELGIKPGTQEWFKHWFGDKR